MRVNEQLRHDSSHFAFALRPHAPMCTVKSMIQANGEISSRPEPMPMKSNDESFSSALESNNLIAIPQSQLSVSTLSRPCKLPNSSFIVDPAFAFLFIYIIQTITHENVNAY